MKFKSIILFVFMSVMPLTVSAATVSISTERSDVYVGDTIIVNVKIDSKSAEINAVEGIIGLTYSAGAVDVRDFNMANSVLTMWPRTPSLSDDAKSVTFTGGVPNGFNKSDASLFQIVLDLKKAGDVTISPNDISAYLNDGKGTKAQVVENSQNSLTIHVANRKNGVPVVDEWQNIVGTDKIPPLPFTIMIGQDDSMYSGKKFAYFSAVDNESGIDHYDVSENGATAVRSGSTYVLQDQDANAQVQLTVTAYDKAGNKQVATYISPSATTASPWSISWQMILVIIVVIALIIIFMSKRNRRVNSNVLNNP